MELLLKVAITACFGVCVAILFIGAGLIFGVGALVVMLLASYPVTWVAVFLAFGVVLYYGR